MAWRGVAWRSSRSRSRWHQEWVRRGPQSNKATNKQTRRILREDKGNVRGYRISNLRLHSLFRQDNGDDDHNCLPWQRIERRSLFRRVLVFLVVAAVANYGYLVTTQESIKGKRRTSEPREAWHTHHENENNSTCFCWIRFSPTLPRTSKEADLFRFPFTYICTHIYKIEIAYIHMHIPYGLANIIFGMYICMYNVYPTHMYVRYVYGHDGRVILVWKVTKIENNTEIYMAICVSRRRTVARRSDLFFSSLVFRRWTGWLCQCKSRGTFHWLRYRNRHLS